MILKSKNNMKRAKIVLAAVAVFAVVGGAFAFKAMDNTKIVFTHNPNDLPTVCTVPYTGITTVENTRPIQLTATTARTLPCTTSTFYIVD